MGLESTPAASAAMTVYLYITKVEITITHCDHIDPENSASYDRVYVEYHNETAQIARTTGFLVGQEARSKGVDKETLLDAVEEKVDIVVQEIERMAEDNSMRFMDFCRDLPKAANAKASPFEPLVQRFPREMNI